MTEDRSLDEFAGREVDESDASTDDERSGDAVTPDSSASDNSASDGSTSDGSTSDYPEPAVSTATWTADGADCERCGERVSRRWRDDAAIVCADCKVW